MLFSEGCNIQGGTKNGIHFTYSSDGRPSGECFVELVSLEDMNLWVNVGKNCTSVFTWILIFMLVMHLSQIVVIVITLNSWVICFFSSFTKFYWQISSKTWKQSKVWYTSKVINKWRSRRRGINKNHKLK